MFSGTNSPFASAVKKKFPSKCSPMRQNDDSDNLNDESEEESDFPSAQQSVPTPISSSQSRKAGPCVSCYCSQSEGSIHFFAAPIEPIPFKLRDSQQSLVEKDNGLQFSQSGNSQFSQKSQSQFSQLSPTFGNGDGGDGDEYFGSQLHVIPAEWSLFPPDSYRCVPVYSATILNQWKREEFVFEVKSIFELQESVTDHIRALLIDGMVNACSYLKVSSRALFLAIKILDIVLSRQRLTPDNMSLTSAACLSLSAKMENSMYPGVKKYVDVFRDDGCDFEDQDLIKREFDVLTIIDYNFAHTTIMQFMKLWLNTVQADAALSQTVMFVAVCSQLPSNLAIMRSETLSLAVMAIAMHARKFPLTDLIGDLERVGKEKIKEVCSQILPAIRGVLENNDSSIYEHFTTMTCAPTRYNYEIPTL